jgi:hypothetical protein
MKTHRGDRILLRTCLLPSDVASPVASGFVRAARVGTGIGLPGRPASRAVTTGGAANVGR